MSRATKASSASARVRTAIGALHLAAIRGDVSMARRALKAGAPVNARARDTDELFNAYSSSISPDLESAHRALSGAPVGAPPASRRTVAGPSGLTALHRAAHAGSAGVVHLLLEKGASVRLESDGGTALTAAAQGGYLQIVRALVDAGADVNHVTSHGMTSLDAAMATKKAKVADYLRARDAVSKIAELHVIARAYAKRYEGKAKRDDHLVDGLPPCRYEVTGRHHRRRLTFRIFDGGCVVEGETQRIASGAISVHLKADRATVPVPQVGSSRVRNPLQIFRDETMTDSEARAAVAAPRVWKAVNSSLCSAHNELVAVLPKSNGNDSNEATFLYVYGDEEGPDFAGLEARLDILATMFPLRGQRAEPAVAREEPVVSTKACRIRIGALLSSSKNDAPHTFGGTLDHDVRCRNCRSPIHLLLTIDTRASELRLRPLGRRDFRIVYCLNCMSFPGLLYIDYSKPKLRVIRQDREPRVSEDGPIPGRKVTLTQPEPAKRSASRIGGTPNWIQGPEVPDCARCREPMAFLAQLASMPDLSFVDEGTLYTFVCTRCKVSASLVQSH